MGCDFAYQNAKQEYKQLERIIQYINKNNKANMTLVMSTPSQYIEELKKENITWGVKYDDAFPYSNEQNDWWVGYFSSRPGAKKQVKDASALLTAEMKQFSKTVIKEDVKDSQVTEVLKAKK